MVPEKSLNGAWWMLKIGYGLGPLLAGADKFTNLLTRWEKYLAPQASKRLPVSKRTFMRTVGVVEMGVGLAILTKWTRNGSLVCAGWLAAIAGNLILDRKYDIAVRDLEMALGAIALARLTEVGAGATAQRQLPPEETPRIYNPPEQPTPSPTVNA